MAERSEIKWTDGTFNPWIGCTKVTDGCDNCYAVKQGRFYAKWGAGEDRYLTGNENWKKPLLWDQKSAKEEQPRLIFCSSLADVFDAEVSNAWRERLWELIGQTPNLRWLLLTKRPNLIKKYLPKELSLDNVWLGTTVEAQKYMYRAEYLREFDAPVKFLSIEPMLGPVTIHFKNNNHLNWIITGGENAGTPRPIEKNWVRSVRDECVAADVAFFHKQWNRKNGRELEPDLVDGVQWRQHPPYGHFENTPVVPAVPATNTGQWSHIEQLIARI